MNLEICLIFLYFVHVFCFHHFESDLNTVFQGLDDEDKVEIEGNIEQEYENFLTKFNKKHAPNERWRKFVFIKNFIQIHLHNKKFEKGLESYGMAVNKFTDLTVEERRKKLRKKTQFKNYEDEANNYGSSYKGSRYFPNTYAKLPRHFDWRDYEAVSDVKDQGSVCGSCWSFGATGTLESHYFLKTGKRLEFSQQQLLDCVSIGITNGCEGGYASDAFVYYMNHGAMPREEYPYQARKGHCHYDEGTAVVKTTGYMRIKYGSESDLQYAVAFQGPVAAAIRAVDKMENYDRGVFDYKNCNSSFADLNHEVLVVGYGQENGKDYWIVKNSYGENWGINGYIKMARNKGNQCGIALDAVYPLL